MYSVIAPKTMRRCESPCVPSEGVVDLNEIELFVSRVELGHRGPNRAELSVFRGVRYARAMRGLRGLGVHESGPHNAVSPIPQSGRASGAGLDDDRCRTDGVSRSHRTPDTSFQSARADAVEQEIPQVLVATPVSDRRTADGRGERVEADGLDQDAGDAPVGEPATDGAGLRRLVEQLLEQRDERYVGPGGLLRVVGEELLGERADRGVRALLRCPTLECRPAQLVVLDREAMQAVEGVVLLGDHLP